LEHLGQSVLFCVSMTFLRSPVLAIFAIVLISLRLKVWFVQPVLARVCLAKSLAVLVGWAEQEDA
jgi:hypothetical protein